MKDWFSLIPIGGFFGFIILLVGFFFYNSGHYRYRVTVPDGRYSASYYTNGYTKRGECITFIESLAKDSTQVCGTYRVQQINH